MTNGIIRYQIFMSYKCAASPGAVQNPRHCGMDRDGAKGRGRLRWSSRLLRPGVCVCVCVCV